MVNLLEEYVARHNHGIVSGNFAPMMDLFHTDAEMKFIGLSAGPFKDREKIAAAFRASPPDDQLVLLSNSCSDTHASGRYGWLREPNAQAGTLDLKLRNGKIARLIVRVGR